MGEKRKLVKNSDFQRGIRKVVKTVIFKRELENGKITGQVGVVEPRTFCLARYIHLAKGVSVTNLKLLNF